MKKICLFVRGLKLFLNRDFLKSFIFLIDGVGALVSVAIVGFVLPHFRQFLGVPVEVLYVLAAIAFVFAIYSLTCFRLIKINKRYWLRIIIYGNTLYTGLSLSFLYYYRQELTLIGKSLFIFEAIVLMFLIAIEWKTYEIMINEDEVE